MAENAIQELASLPDATRMTLQPGQVLYYQDHVPPGVFVLEAGELVAEGDGLPAPTAAKGPTVIPHPSELSSRSQRTVRAATEVRVLFVPRSTIAAGTHVQRLLESLTGPTGEGSLRIAP